MNVLPLRNFKYVKLGAHKRSDVGNNKYYDGTVVPILEWKTYPGAKPRKGPKVHGLWNDGTGGVDADFSILVLGKNVQFTNHIRPVCIPLKKDQDYTNKEVWVSGWGNTKLGLKGGKTEYQKSGEVPKRVKLVVRDEKTCEDISFSEIGVNCEYCGRPTMICAYGVERFNATVNTDTCLGDSGGNIFYKYKLRSLIVYNIF